MNRFKIFLMPDGNKVLFECTLAGDESFVTMVFYYNDERQQHKMCFNYDEKETAEKTCREYFLYVLTTELVILKYREHLKNLS